MLHPIKTLFIEDLCVDQAARGQKIGDQLYQFAVSYAKEIGCYNLTLNVWNDNEEPFASIKDRAWSLKKPSWKPSSTNL